MSYCDPAELIASIAPLMEELVRLCAENRRLWHERAPELPADLAELTRGTPLELRQTESGRWEHHLDFGGINRTGGAGYETPRGAFVAALEHIRSYVRQLQADLDECYNGGEEV